MKITVLSENTSPSKDLGTEHGLSLFVEAAGRSFLFDTGASSLFFENAKKLGLDIKKAEFAVISHGHYDHGGGLQTFINHCPDTKIFIRKEAFGNYYSHEKTGEEKYIGINKALMDAPGIVFTPKRMEIFPNFELFSGVRGSLFNPSGNEELLMDRDGALSPDIFDHEQNLIVTEGGLTYLFAGCAHRGIANIMEQYYRLKKDYPDYVIGGFHLYSKSKDESEAPQKVKQLTEYLISKKSKYLTCHCTGLNSYETMKESLADRIGYLSVGTRLELN